MGNRHQTRHRPGGRSAPAMAGAPASGPAAGREAGSAAGREARSARIAAQVERALAEAAATMAELGDWADFELPAADEPDGEGWLPLEFQLADLERAVDSMIEARDRFLAGGGPRDRGGDEGP